jgi:hypothetical protein
MERSLRMIPSRIFFWHFIVLDHCGQGWSFV